MTKILAASMIAASLLAGPAMAGDRYSIEGGRLAGLFNSAKANVIFGAEYTFGVGDQISGSFRAYVAPGARQAATSIRDMAVSMAESLRSGRNTPLGQDFHRATKSTKSPTNLAPKVTMQRYEALSRISVVVLGGGEAWRYPAGSLPARILP